MKTVRREVWIGLILLLIVSGLFSALHWLKIESLWGDTPLWLFESWRVASGEMIYRDFSYPYPPLGALAVGGLFRVFGSTFVVAQLALIGLSVIIVLLQWSLARRLLPKPVALAVALAFACGMGAGGGHNFYFFALQTYLPAQPLAMAGLLLMLIALVDYIQCGRMSIARWLAISLGSTVALLSKHEQALGVIGTLGMLAVVDARLWFRGRSWRAWRRHYLLIAIAAIGPAMIGFIIVGSQAGFDNLWAGSISYGAGALMCSWWPTGISLFGVVNALMQLPLAVALLSVGQFNAWRARYGRRYLMLWIAAAVGLILTLIYLPAWLRVSSFGEITFDHLFGYVTALGVILLPVMWWSIGRWLWALVQVASAWLKRRPLTSSFAAWMLLITSGVVMSSRNFFGDIFSVTTLVAVATMPIWLIVFPRLLFEAARSITRDDRAADRGQRVIVIALTVFAAANVGRGILADARVPYAPLVTDAGTVSLADPTGAAVYDFVRAHSGLADAIVDVNYGGGVNFAARRRSSIFSNQFQLLFPADRYLQADLDRIQRDPPRLIIANGRPNFNATFGVVASTRCTFPSFVWRPDELAYDPDRSFPVMDYITANYRPAATFDGIVILARGP